MGQSGRRMMVRHEIGARHLAGKVAPLSRFERRGEVDLAHLHRVPIDAFKRLCFLWSLSGTRTVRLGTKTAPGTIKPFTPIELRHGGSGIKRAQMPSTSWNVSRFGS